MPLRGTTVVFVRTLTQSTSVCGAARSWRVCMRSSAILSPATQSVLTLRSPMWVVTVLSWLHVYLWNGNCTFFKILWLDVKTHWLWWLDWGLHWPCIFLPQRSWECVSPWECAALFLSTCRSDQFFVCSPNCSCLFVIDKNPSVIVFISFWQRLSPNRLQPDRQRYCR